MKFSEAWLRELVTINADTKALVEKLTMAGLEVDGTEPAAAFRGVKVGEVLRTQAHPNAENLQICDVASGDGGFVPVVCGAPNARQGLKVAYAPVGATLPDGTVIEKVTLRGVESHGMLCSAAELNLADDNSGILELSSVAEVGLDLTECLALDDTIIEVDLTPNRGDCLSMLGLAREAAALYGASLTIKPPTPVAAVGKQTFEVTLMASSACPRYAGRVITNVDNTRAVPQWLTEKLRRSGIRSVDAVVDVTNYVMLELGQPMHAFDLDKLQDGIEVRYARAGETLTLLGGAQVILDTETLVIADSGKALAMAGILGGEGSGVTAQTTAVFLESAHFNPLSIAGKARHYGLHTDSSHRFERGVDPELPARAIERATELLLNICGGEPGPVVVNEAEAALPARVDCVLRRARLHQQLGVELGDTRVVNILNGLGIETCEQAGGWACKIPSWRFDLGIEADLVEEVARMYGYNHLPVSTLSMPLQISADEEQLTPLNAIKHLLVARDYIEAITYSFVDDKLQQQVSPGVNAVALMNPISADMDVMRTSLATGLLLALRHNLNRQQTRVRLFESGQCFVAGDETAQEDRLGGVVTGPRLAECWAAGDETVDFFDVKGDVEAVLSLTGADSRLVFRAGEHPTLQPGQTLLIDNQQGRAVGYAGKVHPHLEKALGLSQPAYLFELSLSAINQRELPQYREITRFPAVRRDIAVLVDPEVAFGDLRHTVMQNSGPYLRDLKVFDVYHGKHIENNRKSVALGLTFQHNSRTLTDQEVGLAMDAVIAALENDYSAKLRG